jgi:membrane-associated phospholipid phosphatase
VSQAIVDPSFIFDKFNFTGDLFFSGHTGLPFLLALVFWDHPWWRRVFVIVSIIFGVTVLLGHFHYSIDVFGAFFITYTIFHIATRLFPRDYMYLRMTPIAWMRRTLISKNFVI